MTSLDHRTEPDSRPETVPPLATTVAPPVDLGVLDEVQRRVLWLATRIVDAANRERDTGDGVKVGGHQASSASIVTAMTALYFAHLGPHDKVSVKPHASPVFHAIQYLLGNLDRSYLTTLRAAGGLQSYPSRTKDPDRAYIDFSTGSVGLGAAAPLFGAVTRRYVDAHFGERPRSRFVALLGDAELDEGNVWEAIADPVTAGLGNVLWVVDFNRQSLDRVVPGVRIAQLTSQFAAAGWHVVQVKYGRKLLAAFERPHGEALRRWIDDMSNEQYQSLFGLDGPALRERFLTGAPADVASALADVPEAELPDLLTDLGGHDLGAMLDAYAECDAVTDRPSVVFAYTVKGWGLPTAGNPRNHSALLSGDQVDELRRQLGLVPETAAAPAPEPPDAQKAPGHALGGPGAGGSHHEPPDTQKAPGHVPGGPGTGEWDRLDPGSEAGRWVAQRADLLRREEPDPRLRGVTVPESAGMRVPRKPASTQETLGRLLVDLSRDPALAPYLVTAAPDVAVTTNLAGFINKLGVFAPESVPDWTEPDSPLKWRQSPTGQHLELGISEMNLFLLLGQLGQAWDLSGQPLLPVGTVYDPFVCRGLDAFIHATYSGARFVVAGTPSGVSLAPEGGAHQSSITASIGLELPGVTLCEPAYAGALDWLLCDALRRVAEGDEGAATYLRLSTRPVDQAPFEDARARYGDEALRRAVLDGGYRLRDASDVDGPAVTIAASGAVVPEALAAADELAEEGVAAHVVDVTSLDRLYATWRHGLRDDVRSASGPRPCGVLRDLFPAGAPIVTVHDAASHAMAWLGSAVGVPAVPLGVDAFGQSGTVEDLYGLHDLLPGSVVNAALAALAL